MSTYADYQSQIAELLKQAEAVRKNEIAEAKAQIKKIMDDYSLTISDLGSSNQKQAKPRVAVPAKYRDPATGQEWTGRGRSPLWLSGKNKEDYLIK